MKKQLGINLLRPSPSETHSNLLSTSMHRIHKIENNFPSPVNRAWIVDYTEIVGELGIEYNGVDLFFHSTGTMMVKTKAEVLEALQTNTSEMK